MLHSYLHKKIIVIQKPVCLKWNPVVNHFSLKKEPCYYPLNKSWWSYLHWYSVPGFFLQVLLYCTTVYLVFRVALPRHSQDLHGELSFGFPGRAAVLRTNILWSTPPIQKSTIELTLMVSPSMPGIICVWQIWDGLHRVCLHCIPHENTVQAWHDVKADAQASPHIKGTGKDVIWP